MKLYDLFETPIEDIRIMGDWPENPTPRVDPRSKLDMDDYHHGWSYGDQRKIHNPSFIQKVIKDWDKTPFSFVHYFVWLSEPSHYQKFDNIFPSTPDQFKKEILARGFPSNLADEIINQYDPRCITTVHVDNTGDNKVTLSPWMLAHRTGHALIDRASSPKIYELIEKMHNVIFEAYDGISLRIKEQISDNHDGSGAFFNQIMITRAARHKKYPSVYEAMLDLFVMYLLTGKVKLVDRLPKTIDYYVYFLPEEKAQTFNLIDDLSHELREIEAYGENIFNEVLKNSVGTIFII